MLLLTELWKRTGPTLWRALLTASYREERFLDSGRNERGDDERVTDRYAFTFRCFQLEGFDDEAITTLRGLKEA